MFKKIVIFLLLLSFAIGFVGRLANKQNNETDIYSIKIVDSYLVWLPKEMKQLIQTELSNKYGNTNAIYILRRNYKSMYLEWWLHNIGYYVTKPFCFIKKIKNINLRCKDVDLEEWE